MLVAVVVLYLHHEVNVVKVVHNVVPTRRAMLRAVGTVACRVGLMQVM
jgi:hypothetical protein